MLSGSCKPLVDGRAVPAKNLHITLAFLGEIVQPKLDAVKELVTSVQVKPFALYLDQLGYWRRPQIVWAGCENAPPPLIEYQNRLSKGL